MRKTVAKPANSWDGRMNWDKHGLTLKKVENNFRTLAGHKKAAI
jgi:hypothetical protein